MSFKIINHNRHYNDLLLPDLREFHGYDEYTLSYVNFPEFYPDRNFTAHKAQVTMQLQADITPNITQWINIGPAEIRPYGFIFGLYVFEPECSTLIKLTYC